MIEDDGTPLDDNYDSDEDPVEADQDHDQDLSASNQIQEEDRRAVDIDLDVPQSKSRQVMRRRMSALVPMRFERKVEAPQEEVAERLKELIDRFPSPPDNMQFPSSNSGSITNNISNSAIKVVSSSWGSIKSGLEKWGVGRGKKSDDKK